MHTHTQRRHNKVMTNPLLKNLDKQHLCWDGSAFSPVNEATVSLHDLGLRRGYGAFDFLRTYDRIPFLVKEHVLKFINSLNLLNLKLPETVDENALLSIIDELIDQAPLGDMSITLMATAGLSHDFFTPSGPINLFAYTQPLKKNPIERADFIKPTMKTITFPYIRVLPECKSFQYLPAIVAMQQKGTCDEVIYTNTHDELVEASRANFFGVKNGTLITPDKGVLKGASRKVVLETCNMPIEYRPIAKAELKECDELFVTSTLKEVTPIGQIDDLLIHGGLIGPVTQELQKRFKNYVHSYNADYLAKI